MTEIIPHYFNLDLFFQFIRCSELVLFYVQLFNCIISYYESERQKSFFLVLGIIFGSYLNQFIKNYIARPLFGYFNDYIPFMGQGSRPEGAKDCGYFTQCPNKIASSFGFPSGHSQFAGLYSGFMITDIYYSNNLSIRYFISNFKLLPFNKKIDVILYLGYLLIMMYSRVFVQGCHTIFQTIYGASIGWALGLVFHYLFRNYLKSRINNFLKKYVSISTLKIINLILIFLMIICE